MCQQCCTSVVVVSFISFLRAFSRGVRWWRNNSGSGVSATRGCHEHVHSPFGMAHRSVKCAFRKYNPTKLYNTHQQPPMQPASRQSRPDETAAVKIHSALLEESCAIHNNAWWARFPRMPKWRLTHHQFSETAESFLCPTLRQHCPPLREIVIRFPCGHRPRTVPVITAGNEFN